MSLAIPQRTTGELITGAIWNQLVDTINLLEPSTSVITTTGTQTALAIPSGHGDLVIFANNASLLTIQGIAAPAHDGQRLTIYSIGAGNLSLAHENGSASAANRLSNIVTSANIVLANAVGWVKFVYSTTASRWKMLDFEQGSWLTQTYSAGNFSITGGGSWSVEDGDEIITYYLRGRMLEVSIDIAGSSVLTTAGTPLIMAIPGGFQSTHNTYNRGIRVRDNAVETTSASWDVGAANNNINFRLVPVATNWALSTNGTDLRCRASFAVT